MIKGLAISFAIAMAALAPPAKAEIFSVCEVLPTPDGFVALRAKPSIKGKLLARMRPGEMAVIDVRNNDYVKSGKWLRISYHRLAGKAKNGEDDWRFVAKGWAFTDYINECG